MAKDEVANKKRFLGFGRGKKAEDPEAISEGAEPKDALAATTDAAPQTAEGTGEPDNAIKLKPKDWKGLLKDEGRRTKLAAFILLFIVSSSMVFVQWGFIGIGPRGDYAAYALSLFAPVAAAALLLGKGWGALEGLLCGGMLYLHARVQPLDLYERYFVNITNSFVLYAVMGFVFGWLFSRALCSDPQKNWRVIRLGIVSMVGSMIGTFLFMMNSFFGIIFGAIAYAVSTGNTDLSRDFQIAASSMGSLDLQVLAEFAMVFAASLILDIIVRRFKQMRGRMDTLYIFHVYLQIVTIAVFSVAQAFAFSTITIRSEEAAKIDMQEEVRFLAVQLASKDFYKQLLDEMPEQKLSDTDELAEILELIAAQRLMSGYYLNDGTVVVIESDEGILFSDNPFYPVGYSVEDVFGEEYARLQQAAETGEMIQVLYSTEDYEKSLSNTDYVFSKRQIGYAVARRSDKYLVMMARPATMVFEDRAATVRWSAMLALLLLVSVYLLAARLLKRLVVKPVDRINDSLAKITEGDLNEVVTESDTTEFASLSRGINTTVGALKDFINEAERRNERDLATAKTIQESALPQTFPPYPEIGAFDIFASMDAAKEVGGDFYDFFLIDDHTLGFLIADVSGKGIPGALFMMAAKTEIENYLSTGMDPAEAIASANRRLCANNEAGMFVTVWAATLDWETGLLTYVNAGHNFPLLRHDGQWEWLKKKCGLFLGTFETAKYRQETLQLEEGDELLLYTDGVNEAFSPEGEEYGNDRLEAFLGSHANMHAREIVRSLRSDVAHWANGAEQSDDVTILALEYGVAPEVSGTVTYPATLEHLEDATRFVAEVLEERLCPASVQHKVEVALEELFVNVCRYAYADQEEPGKVQVAYAYGTSPSSITIELRDQGVPFDPVMHADPTKPMSFDDVGIGGLGILMVRKTMDDLVYMRDGDTNVVVIRKMW